jgi:flagellar L-ring protein precursor FlgH
MKLVSPLTLCCLTAVAMLLATVAPVIFAQTSSLYQRDLPVQGGRVLTLPNSSFLYQAPPMSKELRRHDIITVLVDEKSQVISEDEFQRKKNASIKAVLTDWVSLSKFFLKPARQSDGNPAVAGTTESQLKAEGDLERRDGMKFFIAAKIVDIRRNGNLVLEAHRQIRNNDEVWEFSLTGIIRQEDVLPDNTVLSRNIVELHIYKRERGHVRDAVKRNWGTKLLDMLKPF